MKRKISITILLLYIVILSMFTACSEGEVSEVLDELNTIINEIDTSSNNTNFDNKKEEQNIEDKNKADEENNDKSSEEEDDKKKKENDNKLNENEFYYDVENVVLYLYYYDKLPSNYITKKEAQNLGWSGGSTEKYKDGSSIGGDKFGNREGLLPSKKGRKYTECDIDTDGRDSRGAKRLVFSNDGLYFYTKDHYNSFVEIKVEDGKIIWK